MTEQTQAMAARQQPGAIATEAPHNPWATAGLLKPYAGGIVHEAPKVDALATISAGYKNAEGYPVVSRDGTIYVRGADRAPGLVAALERRGNKALTIALVHNEPKDVLQQWFASYSKTRLEARGDAHEITVIHLKDTGKRNRKGDPILEPHREYVSAEGNPDRYRTLVADMKVQTSLYFALAEWDGEQPRLIFPDGLGLYRLHFTSLNSAEAIKSQLSYIASLTGGRVAGVPLELSITYRNLAGPDGVRRDRVPIWSLVLQPPQTISLSPQRVAAILQSGIEQAQQLAIAAPRPEPLEYAEYEGPDVDLDTTAVVDGEIVQAPPQRTTARRESPPIRDPKRFCQLFMMQAKGSSLEDKENRSQFLIWATSGIYDSLKTFAESATHDEGARLMELQAEWLRKEAADRQERRAAGEDVPYHTAEPVPAGRRYEDVFGDDDEPPAAPETTPKTTSAVSAAVHHAAILTGAPERRVELPAEPDWGSWEAQEPPRTAILQAWVQWTVAGKKLDPSADYPDPAKLSNGQLISALGSIVTGVERAYRERYGVVVAEPDEMEGLAF